LGGKIGRQIAHILITQRRRLTVHDGVIAITTAVGFKRMKQVVSMLTGEHREGRIIGVAFGAMAGHATLRLAPTGLNIANRLRSGSCTQTRSN